MISIIVAIADNYAIGKNNELLWHLPNDLKRFKELTSGHKILMGRNTWLSLPRKPLPNRTNIVISDVKDEVFDECLMLRSFEEAIEYCNKDEEIFVIGGGMVYSQFLPLADKLYITKVDANFEADTFFPEISENLWNLVFRENFRADEKNPFDYSFLIFERKK